MNIRRAAAADLEPWAAMLARLNTDMRDDEWESALAEFISLSQPYIGFIAFADDRSLG